MSRATFAMNHAKRILPVDKVVVLEHKGRTESRSVGMYGEQKLSAEKRMRSIHTYTRVSLCQAYVVRDAVFHAFGFVIVSSKRALASNKRTHSNTDTGIVRDRVGVMRAGTQAREHRVFKMLVKLNAHRRTIRWPGDALLPRAETSQHKTL